MALEWIPFKLYRHNARNLAFLQSITDDKISPAATPGDQFPDINTVYIPVHNAIATHAISAFFHRQKLTATATVRESPSYSIGASHALKG